MRTYQLTLHDDGSVTVQDEHGAIFASFREQAPQQTLAAYTREQAALGTSALLLVISKLFS